MIFILQNQQIHSRKPLRKILTISCFSIYLVRKTLSQISEVTPYFLVESS